MELPSPECGGDPVRLTDVEAGVPAAKVVVEGFCLTLLVCETVLMVRFECSRACACFTFVVVTTVEEGVPCSFWKKDDIGGVRVRKRIGI